MGRRTLLLLASILVAAAGTALIWVYVQNADTRAQQAEQLVPVLVATGRVEIGNSASQIGGEIATRSIPESMVTTDNVRSVTDILGRSATVTILPGELLLKSQFNAVGPVSGVAAGKMAVGVMVQDPNRVAGLLHPGMNVAIYYVDPSAGRNGSAKILLPNVPVLAVGNTTVVMNARGQAAQIGTQSGVSAANIILEVDNSTQAEQLMLASAKSALWFTVLGNTTKASADDPGVSGADLPVWKG